jgi:hypothetical protein
MRVGHASLASDLWLHCIDIMKIVVAALYRPSSRCMRRWSPGPIAWRSSPISPGAGSTRPASRRRSLPSWT